ncbi:YjbF family lipoprotein [Rhodanobacter ginsengiterrae]|uniref:YjbF family lipoprotein n=1 Tax=Rhodanobacter ginsengiterrae TaxID=2008451 RepID=UPI003CEF2735
MPPDPLTNPRRTAPPQSRRAAARTLPAWLLLLACPLLFGLHGCSELSRSSVNAMKLAVKGKPKVQPTAAEVAAKPYFQLQASSPEGSAVLILGNVDGQRQAWYGSHGVVVFIAHGRVVQTTGLGQNLDGVQLPADDPLAGGLQTLAAPVTYRMLQDWSPGYRYGVPVEATLTPAGHEQLSILGQTHDVLRVDEQLRVPSLHYRASNHYWVDPRDGFIWKSEQQVAPGLSLQLVQLRPYREPQR